MLRFITRWVVLSLLNVDLLTIGIAERLALAAVLPALLWLGAVWALS